MAHHTHAHSHEHQHERPFTPPENTNHGHVHDWSRSQSSMGIVQDYDMQDDKSYTSPIRIDHDYDTRNDINDDAVREVDDEAGMPSASTASTMLSPGSAGMLSATTPGSQWGQWTPATPQSAGLDGGFQPLSKPTEVRNPFNFTSQQYVAGPKSLAARSSAENLPGKRRGHKYRHSSIHTSHQIFQAPVQRTPLSVPAALPMPTRKEAWWSMTSHQTLRLLWCLCHFLTSAYVQFSASGSLSLTALSRLLLFDAAGATVCVAVDVMSNFEVWQRGSIKHPFGLERADVLAGFGLAVFIGFMGLDVVSHGLQHALENLGDHVPHNAHSHARASAGSVDLDCLLAIIVTLISALVLKNHARLGRSLHLPSFLGKGGNPILSNPAHLLTLSCSTLLLFLPLFGPRTYAVVDTAFSFLIAALMITLGVRLGTSLASMLLMSYRHPVSKTAVREFIADVEREVEVERAEVWQVHYGLCLANLKLRIRVGGYGDEAARIRQRVQSLVRSRFGGVYGEGSRGPRWDVSVQMVGERD